jgi:hypothetical protein
LSQATDIGQPELIADAVRGNSLPLAGVAHALALFFLVGILCTLSSLAWLLLAAYKALRTNRSLFGEVVLRRVLVVVALLAWASMFALPQ